MNAQLPHDEFEDDANDAMREALVTRFELTDTQIERILGLMQTNALGFAEAAVRLGILTHQEIADVLQTNRSPRPHAESTLVETAIRRISSDRRIVVRQGERVKPSSILILAHEPDNPRSEKIRALRTELLLLNEGNRGANVVPVLSAGSGEGRSLLCAELAISFAQLGRRTLLLDADMRRPQQHVLFDSTNEHGLSQAVAHNEKPYFHPVIGLPHMHLLTAGPVPPNPLELLSDGRFAAYLNEWRNTYEFVVIDTPPVSQCADGLAVATMAGRVLVLSRAEQSTFKDTRELLRRLANTHSRILGAVINHF